jgi:2'-5' RNA ligase
VEQVRCFVAVELPDGLKQDLVALQDRLKAGSPSGVRWVDPHGIHLTLKFLGNVAAGRLPEIVRALRQAARGVSPFHLTAGGLGVFPNTGRVRVVWVGLTGDLEGLRNLQRRTESALAPLGFPAESRPFSPHLTLARVRDQVSPADRQGLGALVEGSRFESAWPIDVAAVHLMRSQLTGRGAVYSVIESVALDR